VKTFWYFRVIPVIGRFGTQLTAIVTHV